MNESATGRPLRAMVIGCGAIAEEHLAHLATSPRADLAAVCDLSPALARIARDRHGARLAGSDVDELLTAARPDVVHVLTPPRTHPELVRRAVAAGAHVVCEKPLAPSAAETVALLDDAERVGRVLVETRNLLYNDVLRELDAAVDAGRVGEVREVDVALALPLGEADVPPAGLGVRGGIAHDYLPHLAYLFLHLAASPGGEPPPIDHVTGTVGNLSGRPEIGLDHVDAAIRAGAVRGRLRISPDVVPSALRLVVRGTGGTLEADVYQPYVRHEGPPWVGKRAPFGLALEGLTLVRAGGRNVRDRLLQHGTYHGMGRMLDAVYAALAAGEPPPVRRADMVASATLIDRVLDLAQAGS